jgi:hypothetical protein
VYYRGPVGIEIKPCDLLLTEHLPHVHAEELTLQVGTVGLDRCKLCPGRDRFDHKRKALDTIDLATRPLIAVFDVLRTGGSDSDNETAIFGRLAHSDVSYLPMALQRVEGEDPPADGAMGVTLLESPGVEIQLSADEAQGRSVVGSLTVTEASLSNGEKWLASAAIFRFSDAARRALTSGRDGALYVAVDFDFYNDEVDDIGWLTLEDMASSVGARSTKHPASPAAKRRNPAATTNDPEPNKPRGSSVTDRDIESGEPDPDAPGATAAQAANRSATKRRMRASARSKKDG